MVRRILFSKATRNRFRIFIFAGLTFGLSACAAFGQDSPLESDPASEPQEELTAPEQIVEVDEAVEDVDIGDRLQKILESTERFIDPAVRVENGVVFLSGVTRQPEHKDWARQLASKTQDVVAVVNNINVDVVEPPIWDFDPALKEIRGLWRDLIQGFPLFFAGLAILILTYMAARATSAIVDPMLRKRIDSGILRDVLRKTVIVFVGIIGIYLFLRISGLTRLALAMLSGTGIIGLLVGFAFRDIAENFLASVLISIQRPFRVGDTIEVEGYTGIVQKVTTRGTVLMAYDGNYIQIANSAVYKNTIRNYTANPNLRLDFGVGVGYDAGVLEPQTIIMAVLRKHAAVLDEPEPSVLVEALGSSNINLRVYFWINCHDHSRLKVKSAVIRLTLAALTEAGVPMPDDAREVVFPEGIPLLSTDKLEHDEEKHLSNQEAVDRAKLESLSVSAESEGDLSSEVDELNAQARASELPEEGRDLMSENDEAGIRTHA